MKKLLLVGALALFGIYNAQETKFGLKGGYAMSTLNNKSSGVSISSDAKSTFYVGGLVQHRFNDKFALQGEVLYSDLGGQISESENSGGYYMKITQKTNLGSLIIPVSVKYFATEGLALSAGLNFGFIVSAKTNIAIDHNLPLSSSEIDQILQDYGYKLGDNDVKDQVSSFNFGPFLGAEYNLSNGLFFDTRYNFGVTNLEKNSSNGTTHNKFWQIGLGYKFK